MLAEYALKRSTNDPAVIERLQSLSGIVDNDGGVMCDVEIEAARAGKKN
jgi:hypothetical protein